MELKQIRQFVALCDAQNFHRAAKALNMSQPPLSISIRKLEAEMGVKLFERHARGVKLTEAGLASLPYARKILTGVEAMSDAASATVDGMSGRLSVGFVGSAVYSLIPKVVPLFRSLRPSVDLRLREMTTLEIIRELETGDLDVGVLRMPVFDVRDVALEALYREEMILLFPKKHPLRDREVIRLEDLREEAFIGYDRTRLPNYRNLMLSACEAAGFQPRIVEETAHLHTLIALVESGLGVGLAPAVSRVPAANRVSYARLTVQGTPIMVGLALATRPDENRPTQDAFIATLREAAARLTEVDPFLADPGITAHKDKHPPGKKTRSSRARRGVRSS